MRLIDADALKKDDELTEWLSRDAIRTGKMLKRFSELFIKKIDNAPTVCDIEQIRAEILSLHVSNYSDYAMKIAVIDIIDKYTKGESE